MRTDFFQAQFDQLHPEVRELIGRIPFTAVIMLTVLGIQTALAFLMGRLACSSTSFSTRVIPFSRASNASLTTKPPCGSSAQRIVALIAENIPVGA
jgi:hypothetical protein